MKRILFITIFLTIIMDKYLPPSFFGFRGFTLTNVVIGLIFILLISYNLFIRQLKDIKIPALWASIIFLIYAFLNIIVNKTIGYANLSYFQILRVIKNEIIQPLILFILPFLFNFNKKESQYTLIWGVIIFIGLNSFLLLNPGTYFNISSTDEYYMRFTGILGSPNKNAYILTLLIPIEIYFLKNLQNKMLKFVLIIFFGISIIGILASGSRGAILCLIIIFFFMIIKYKINLLPIFIIFICCIIIIIYYLSTTPLFKLAFSRLSRTFSTNIDTASSGRLYIWTSKVSYFFSNLNLITILFGFGPGMSLYLGTKFPIPCHNLYLKLILEYGIIGIIIVSCICFYLIKFVRTHTSRNKEWEFCALLSLLVIPIAWMFTSLTGVQDIISFIIGLILSYSKFIGEEKNEF